MAKKVIEIKNLSYSYPDGTPALKSIDLDVSEGDTLGIVGPNGAGKSTLLLHLNGILRGNGNIKVLDSEVSEKKLKHIRSKVGMVFQDPDNQLFMPTVFEDVAFGPLNYGLPPEEVRYRVRDALKAVEMSGFEDRVPHHLSFGEKKRVSLATILSMSPDIILLDEPTSNLDPRGRRKVIEVIGNLKVTKIIATHDLEMALELCERGVILDSGRIIADGQMLDILKNKDLLEAHGLEVPYSLR